MIILYRHYPSKDHIACITIQNLSVYNYYPIFYLYYKTTLSCIIVAKLRYPLASHLFPKSTEYYGQAILKGKSFFVHFIGLWLKAVQFWRTYHKRLHLRNELEFPWLVHTQDKCKHTYTLLITVNEWVSIKDIPVNSKVTLCRKSDREQLGGDIN